MRENEEFLDFGKTTGTKAPRFDLIPLHALLELVERYELGEEKHAGKTWNARTDQSALDNEEWIIARASHVIKHALIYIEKYLGLRPDDGDNDAAAIMWGGSLLSAAVKRRKDITTAEWGAVEEANNAADEALTAHEPVAITLSERVKDAARRAFRV